MQTALLCESTLWPRPWPLVSEWGLWRPILLPNQPSWRLAFLHPAQGFSLTAQGSQSWLQPWNNPVYNHLFIHLFLTECGISPKAGPGCDLLLEQSDLLQDQSLTNHVAFIYPLKHLASPFSSVKWEQCDACLFPGVTGKVKGNHVPGPGARQHVFLMGQALVWFPGCSQELGTSQEPWEPPKTPAG